MSIEKCLNFKRDTNRSGQEVSWCTVAKVDMRCGGYSDKCPMPKEFVPIKRIPKEYILFTNEQGRLRPYKG